MEAEDARLKFSFDELYFHPSNPSSKMKIHRHGQKSNHYSYTTFSVRFGTSLSMMQRGI